jgi:hypothetical protein
VLTGGAVVKFGDRYEGRWTVLQAIRVLRGECDGISLEEIGEAGEGVEFRLDHQDPDEPDEVHQVKRQRSEGDWTMAALKSAGVLEAFRKHLTASSATCVFVSSTSTRSLARLADDASRVRRLEAFEATLSHDADKEYQALRLAWGGDGSFTHAALARCRVRTIDEESLVHQVVELLAFRVEGDPRNALDILAAYLVDRVHQRVTAAELWQHLRDRGHLRRPVGPDPALSETVREVTERLTAHVERSRPATLPLLARDEVAQIVADLTSADGPATVAVTGEAGAGKSSVLAAVADALQARGVVVGAVRLDTLDPARTADELGRDAGYPGPPARVTALAAAGRPAVLLVDQLDAVSLTGGQDQRLVDALEEVFAQARATAALRLLVACRSFDLAHDRRLRQLLTREVATADGEDHRQRGLREVLVGALSDAQVDEALTALGVPRSGMPDALRHLLRNAFNLGLFATLVAEGGFTDYAGLHTRFDLLREFEKVKRNAMRRRGLSDAYMPAVRQLAAHLSSHGRLWAPYGVLGELADTRDALLSEGVLVRDGRRLRFFHEAYFDYVFADAHVSGGGSARSLLDGDAQDLFRRAQVRGILAYERDLDPAGAGAYLADLAELLRPGRIRAHIRAVVLDGLSAQRSVLDGEFRLVERIVADLDDPMRSRALRLLASGGWPVACHQRDRFRQYVAELVRRTRASPTPSPPAPLPGAPPLAAADLVRWTTDELLYQLVWSTKELPDEAAAACRPLAEYPEYAYALLRLVGVAKPSNGTACAELLQGLIAAADPDHGPQGLAVFEDDFWSALHTLAAARPDLAVAVVRRWLERAGQISVDRGGAHAFDREATVLPARPSGLDVLADLAVRASEAVLEELLPWLVGEVERARAEQMATAQPRSDALRRDRIFPLHTEEGLRFEDEVLHAVRDALSHLAAARPTRATRFLATCRSSDLQTLQLLAARAYAAADPILIDDALTWAAQPPVRGLPRGATPAWATREVLTRAAAVGSPAQQAEAIRLVLDPYRDLAIDNNAAAAWTDSERRRAAEQLVLADGVAAALADRCPEELAGRLRELVAILGSAPTTWQDTITVRFVDSPVPDEEARAFSDDEWLQAAARYSGEDVSLSPDGTFAGNALQLAHILGSMTSAEPTRFAALLGRLGPTAHPAYASAILRGLHGTNAAAIATAVREVRTWPNRPHGSEICDALASVADADLDDDLIGVVAWHARDDPDPQAEVWQQLAPGGKPYYDGDPNFAALNCVRGRAVRAIATLLYPQQHRTPRLAMLRDTVTAMVDDPVEQVRVMLPAALKEVWKADAPAAAKLLRAWAGRASEIGLTAGELPRLLMLVDLTDPGLAAELVARLLRSHHAPVRQTAGGLAAFFQLRAQQSASSGPVLQSDDSPLPHDNALGLALADASARAGVADALGSLVDELVDDLPELTTPATTGSSPPTRAGPIALGTAADVETPGQRLLVRLLDDDDPAVRSAAMQFPRSLRRPLVGYSTLLTTIARTQGFADDPQTLLYALRQRAGELPDTVVDLCDRFLDEHGAEAADMRTRASASASTVIKLVLAMHTQSPVGSVLRARCLDLVDRVVILGLDTIHMHLEAYER